MRGVRSSPMWKAYEICPLPVSRLLALPSRLDAATALSGEGAPIIPIATDADFARMVKQTVDGYTVPAYRELQSRARDLVAEVEGYCAAPSDETREELRGAFADMLRAWAGVDFFHFGPIAQDGRYERFAYWPDVHGTGARQLRRVLASGDAKLLEPGALASQSAAVQGLPALETLLFQGESALLSEAAPDVFRCALSEAIAENSRRSQPAPSPDGRARRLDRAHRKSRRGQSRLPHTRGGGDGDPEGGPDGT